MDAIVAHVACAVVPMPVPVIVEAVFVEREEGCGSSPCLKIHAIRYGSIVLMSDVVSHLDVPSLGHQSLANAARPYGLCSTNETGEATIPGPMLHHALVAAGRLHHQTTLLQIVGTRFLDVDIFASLAAENRGRCVPVI